MNKIYFEKYGSIIKLFISFAIISSIIMFFNVDIIKAIYSVQNKIFIYVCLLIPIFINPLISNNKWKIILSVQGVSEKFLTLLKISFISIFLGLILPATAGSDAIRIYYIEKRQKQLKGAGGASIIIERLLGLLVLSFVGIIGSLVAILNGFTIILLYITSALFLFILSILITLKTNCIFQFTNRQLSKIKLPTKISYYIVYLYKSLKLYPLNRMLISTIPLILAYQLSTILCGVLLFSAFDIYIPLYYHLIFIPLITIISIIPISISGFGIREGGFVYFYGLLGVDRDISFLVSLLYYAVLILVPALIGMIIYLFDGVGYKQNEKNNNS